MKDLTPVYYKYILLIANSQEYDVRNMKGIQFSEEYQELRHQLAQTGYICTGSISTVYRKCGKQYCVCAKNETVLHGPYNVWTRKVKGKTVTRNLTEDQTLLCRECIQNLRQVEKLIEKMKELTAKYIEDSKTDQRD